VYLIKFSSHSGVSPVEMLEDTARTNTIVLSGSINVDGNIDVTRITPPGTPGVSDLDDFDTVHLSPTNGVDGVVKATVNTVAEDTTRVTHELVVGIDSDGKRTVHKGLLHSSNRVGCNSLGATVGLNSSVASLLLADTNRASVFVVFLRPEGVLGVGNRVKDGSGPSTTATIVVTVTTVNNLLLRKGDKTITGNSVVGLKDLSGGESVAGTA